MSKLTADTITDEQIRELRVSDGVTPAIQWECSIVLDQHKMKRRANKTKARIAAARSRCAEIINARKGGV